MDKEKVLVPEADLQEVIDGTNKNHESLVEQNKLLEERNKKLFEELEKRNVSEQEEKKLNEQKEKTRTDNETRIIELLEENSKLAKEGTNESKKSFETLDKTITNAIIELKANDDDEILKDDFQHFTDLSIVFFLYMIIPFLLTIHWLSKFFDKTI